VGLTAGYNYNLAESNSGFLRSNEAVGWTYGANLRFNLFDGFSLRRDYRNAGLAISGAGLQYDEVKAAVEADLARARDEYGNAMQMLGLERDNLETARQTLDMAMERLRLGSITALDLRAVQEKFVAAETRLTEARYEAKRAETQLLLLAGRLTPNTAP
jgi:outer membrane protein